MSYHVLTPSVVRKAIQTVAPPPDLSLSEWADTYAVLSPESAAEPGRWRTLPYQKGILDAFTDPKIERVTFMKSARVGYTKALNWAVAYHMHQDPCSILLVQPTIDDAQGYSKDEIAPMLRDVPCLQGLVTEGYRDSSNTILKKLFPGGSLNLVGANSARGFRRLTCRVVLFDEVDGYPPTAGEEGDQIALGIRRSDTFWNRKIAIGSTPTIAGLSRVERSYLASDQRRYFVPCPHCGEFQYLKWAQMKWPEGRPHEAHYVCEHCQRDIDHQQKRWMVERGEWRATAPFTGHAGFHLWAAYSYSPNATWGKLAEEWMAAQSDREALKTFVNTVLGEPWTEKGETVSGTAIYERREAYKAAVPNGSVITAGVDVQDDRLEVDVVAWGDGEESWSVDYWRIYGDPARAELWEELYRRLSTSWLRIDGAQIECRCVCIDSGGHFTDEVYAFSRKRGVRWAVPVKGASEGGKPIAMFPRTLNQKRVYLTHVGTDTAKELIYRRLKADEPGPGYMHFPIAPAYDAEYFQQLTAEKAVTKYRNGRPYVQWEKLRPRNEALDCRVYALTAVRILQQHGGVALETIDPDAEPPEPKPEPPRPPSFIRQPEAPRPGVKSWFGNYRR